MFEAGKEEVRAIEKVFESGAFMRYRGGEGGFTEQFEANMCRKLGVKHALTMNSGTNALISALVALGVGRGDEVIVPAYTWVASAMVALMAGAVPVLADIDESLCLSPEAFEKAITPRTKAVIPVHMNNRLCDMKSILAIAEKHGILVVEDACQAVGLQYADGRYAGAIGQAGCFSFNVFKNIMCGEGGMLLTDCDQVYERALMFHDAGCYTREHASKMTEAFFPGFNFRVSELQGAVLFEQYKRLDAIMARLAAHKAMALEILSASPAFRIAPENDPGTMTVALTFESAGRAEAYAKATGIFRISDSGRHIFTNWTPVVTKAWHNESDNPHNFSEREIDYSAESYAGTLDIISRTALVDCGYAMDEQEYRAYCEKLAACRV